MVVSVLLDVGLVLVLSLVTVMLLLDVWYIFLAVCCSFLLAVMLFAAYVAFM
jgi:hypothetical protein